MVNLTYFLLLSDKYSGLVGRTGKNANYTHMYSYFWGVIRVLQSFLIIVLLDFSWVASCFGYPTS